MEEQTGSIPPKNQEYSKKKGEVILSSIFVLISIWLMYRSVVMSIIIHQRTEAAIYTLPGMFPFIVSMLIFFCSLSIILKRFKEGFSFGRVSLKRTMKTIFEGDARVFLITMGSMLIYVGLLIPFLPFEIATFVFVLVLFRIFKAAKLVPSLIISLTFSVVVVFFFAVVVRTPFPHTYF